jgi:uncharacterized Ntn-hydrolase superfamily protein
MKPTILITALIVIAFVVLITFRKNDRAASTALEPDQVWPDVNTFSIVAYDPERKEWGVAVASRVLAVGSVVTWVKAGSGAVATQSAANVTYGPKGLELLASGKSADEVVKILTEADDGRNKRQIGIIDSTGKAASFTGSECIPWAGGKVGENYCVQGNILTGEAVVNDMATAFENAKGPLAWRMMAALEAGEKAGGDSRGKQSAALYIARERGGYNRMNDRFIDLRVDDHENPVQELARILAKQVKKPE